jgi:hypothetical protein
MTICCQINNFKIILSVKFYFVRIDDNFEATGLFFFKDLSKKSTNFDEISK